ncbi:MAG: GNAT family N-acetyltransferase [Cyanothece sp. SIO2G6]|nr:GNAT family N-acetyltransferase [Cyanothece sp. SIO2G6]
MDKRIIPHPRLQKEQCEIYLKPMEKWHISHLIKLAREPGLSGLLGWSPHFEPDETEEFIQAISLFAFPYSLSGEPLAFGIYHFTDTLPIGYAVLKGINWEIGTTEIGISILDGMHRNKGYGTMATRQLIDYTFHALNFQLIGAAVLVSNVASVNLFRKLGFIIKTTMYGSWIMPDGNVEDMLRMELTTQIWSGKQHQC